MTKYQKEKLLKLTGRETKDDLLQVIKFQKMSLNQAEAQKKRMVRALKILLQSVGLDQSMLDTEIGHIKRGQSKWNSKLHVFYSGD